MNFNNGIVRLQEINIENFKNVKKGTASFQSYKNIKNKEKQTDSDIIGIYGQNGSGKTSLVESLGILKSLLSGEKINKEIIKLLCCNTEESRFSYIFKLSMDSLDFLINYSYTLKIAETEEADTHDKYYVQVIKEDLKYTELVQNQRISWKSIVNYDASIKNETFFKPKEMYTKIINGISDGNYELIISKEFSKKDGTSFIFSNKCNNIFNTALSEDNLSLNIINNLRYFAKFNLFVITNQYLGHINLLYLMPFSFLLKNPNGITKGTVAIPLFDSSVIEDEQYNILEKIKEQINIVLQAIIPGLTIKIKILKEVLTEDGSVGKSIELLSVRDDAEIPLKYESEGIKKIISILSALIAMYNNEKVCVVVDELDAGIFEYLLGELLKIFKENSKGQLIFTSHNLRPLEVLDKIDVIFTTTNKENRYIRLKNIKKTNNLRDSYLREIFLGNQDETVYEKTKSYKINRAFRKAGSSNVE